jgi:hypothetical protein
VDVNCPGLPLRSFMVYRGDLAGLSDMGGGRGPDFGAKPAHLKGGQSLAVDDRGADDPATTGSLQ